MATHEEHDSAISSLIVQVIICVWLPVVGRSSTWPMSIHWWDTIAIIPLMVPNYSSYKDWDRTTNGAILPFWVNLSDHLQKSASHNPNSERKKILTSSPETWRYGNTDLAVFVPLVDHFPCENSILLDFYIPRVPTILGCESHSQAGLANFHQVSGLALFVGVAHTWKGWGQIVKLLQLVDSFLLSANQKPPFLLWENKLSVEDSFNIKYPKPIY